MEFKILLRGFSLTAILMAGSCAAPMNDGSATFNDAAVNNPITVEPAYQSMKIYYAPGDMGGSSEQARLEDFVDAYITHGNGSIAVSVPAGRNAPQMIGYFAQAINDLGVPKNRIIVATHDAPDGDARVNINYVSYRAATNTCGRWTENLAYSADNLTPKNFGCAVQQNIAAQIADPRDLLVPREMANADAARRATVMGNYQQGKVTQAEKRIVDVSAEQSAPGANVGH